MADPPLERGEVAEGELIARARNGDGRAYEEIVKRHQSSVFRVAYSICGTREDAEEAAQDACFKAYRALGRFRAGSPFRPWLLRIAANEARNRVSSSGRRRGMFERLVAAADELDSPGLEEAVIEATERRTLLAAVGSLPAGHRNAIACRFLLGLSETETAAALGCRPGTVKSRTARGLARLRTELEEASDE